MLANIRLCLVAALLAALTACTGMPVAPDVPRMNKEALRAAMEDDPTKVVVLDVRSKSQWAISRDKIEGALREEPGRLQQWKDKYPKDRLLVLYCA